MRKLLVILLSVELLAAIIAGQSALINRKDYDRAFGAWYEDRMPEKRAEWDRQRRLNEISRWETSSMMFVGMAMTTLLGSATYRLAAKQVPVRYAICAVVAMIILGFIVSYIALRLFGVSVELGLTMKTKDNKPEAPNAAMVSLFQSEHRWRGVGEPDRYTCI